MLFHLQDIGFGNVHRLWQCTGILLDNLPVNNTNRYTNLQEQPEMKKEITLGQAIAIIVTIMGTVLTSWITTSNRITKAEADIENLKQSNAEYRSDAKEIKATVNSILIKMENKADRGK